MISKPGDVSAMVENISELIMKPELMQTIRKNGWETIEYLDWDKSADRISDLLKYN